MKVVRLPRGIGNMWAQELRRDARENTWEYLGCLCTFGSN